MESEWRPRCRQRYATRVRGPLDRAGPRAYTGAMSKHWAIIVLALWLFLAVAMNLALVSRESSAPVIPMDDLADAFV